jgi:transposase
MDVKDIKTKHRFVELRAQDKSLRTAADELGIGLQTAVRWERKLKGQIDEMRATEVDALCERHRLTVQAQIERYGVELARVAEEIEKRDLAEVPTHKLYDILIKLHTRVDAARPVFTLRGDDQIADQEALRELIAARRARKESDINACAGRQGNGNGTLRAEDLVTLQLTTLHRLRAGEIDGRTAAHEVAMVNSIYNGIELADVQTRLERLETVLGNKPDARREGAK